METAALHEVANTYELVTDRDSGKASQQDTALGSAEECVSPRSDHPSGDRDETSTPNPDAIRKPEIALVRGNRSHATNSLASRSTSSLQQAVEIELQQYSSNRPTSRDSDSDDTLSSPTPVCAEGKNQKPGLLQQILQYWHSNIHVEVPWKYARDHLALERTFLAYHRTSMTLAISSTIIAQLFILNHAPHPDPAFGFHAVGRPLAVTMAGLAVMFAMVGWARWFRWQHAMLRGKAVVGGWELKAVGGVFFLMISTCFGLILGIHIDKVYFKK